MACTVAVAVVNGGRLSSAGRPKILCPVEFDVHLRAHIVQGLFEQQDAVRNLSTNSGQLAQGRIRQKRAKQAEPLELLSGLATQASCGGQQPVANSVPNTQPTSIRERQPLMAQAVASSDLDLISETEERAGTRQTGNANVINGLSQFSQVRIPDRCFHS